MSTELSNGVIIPEEYSDDWYDEMSINLRKLNDVITAASDNATDIQRLDTDKANQSDLTSLSGRVTQNETDITALQTAVSTAQASANSAQQTATTARQQSYVFRYSSTALTDSSTNSNSLLDNTDNLKVGDKVIDSSGVLFSITAIDTANSTFTIGTALIDLALDSDVVHKSGAETIGGNKTFSDRATFSTTSVNGEITFKQNAYDPATNGQSSVSGTYNFILNARTVTNGSFGQLGFYGGPGFTTARIVCRYYTGANVYDETYIEYVVNGTSGSITGRSFKPSNNGLVDLGTSNSMWKSVYATNYYYGANNVEFSTKFVTTDTNQTITGSKTFSSINGVEPSSLSLPSGNANDVIDISSYFSNTGSGGTNSYTASANGWIYLYVTVCKTLTAYIQNATDSLYADYRERSSDGQIRIMLPIQKNNVFTSIWTTGSTVTVVTARFIPCQGNV